MAGTVLLGGVRFNGAFTIHLAPISGIRPAQYPAKFKLNAEMRAALHLRKGMSGYHVAFNLASSFRIAPGGFTLTASPGPATIRAAITDLLSMFGVGCCANPPPCLLTEAITALNAALQQFHLSEKTHAFLTGQKVQIYTAAIDSQIFLDGAELPSMRATTLGVATDYTVQHVQRVVWSDSYTRRTHHLRPVGATTLTGNLTGADSAAGVGSGQWYEDAAQSDPPSTDDVPFFFEVFRNKDKLPMIRCFPDGSGASDGYISVHITPEPRHLSTLDYTSGATFDIAPPYVELYLMPIARFSALHSIYCDPVNVPQKQAIETRYREVLGFLGLASIQPREVELAS